MKPSEFVLIHMGMSAIKYLKYVFLVNFCGWQIFIKRHTLRLLCVAVNIILILLVKIHEYSGSCSLRASADLPTVL